MADDMSPSAAGSTMPAKRHIRGHLAVGGIRHRDKAAHHSYFPSEQRSYEFTGQRFYKRVLFAELRGLYRKARLCIVIKIKIEGRLRTFYESVLNKVINTT